MAGAAADQAGSKHEEVAAGRRRVARGKPACFKTSRTREIPSELCRSIALSGFPYRPNPRVQPMSHGPDRSRCLGESFRFSPHILRPRDFSFEGFSSGRLPCGSRPSGHAPSPRRVWSHLPPLRASGPRPGLPGWFLINIRAELWAGQMKSLVSFREQLLVFAS